MESRRRYYDNNNNREGDDEDIKMAVKPAWLEGLMAETFFGSCGVHENLRKSEKNVFCLLCCLSICPHCLPSHRSHPLLQVRRYVYHDVIRLSDLEKLIDCSYIQPYTINGAKVIFLNHRPQTRSKGSANICFTCDRILQDPFASVLSLARLIIWYTKARIYRAFSIGSTRPILHFRSLKDYGSMDRTPDPYDDGQITMNSMLDDQMQYKGSSCSSQETMDISGISHQTAEMVNKKKKKGFLSGNFLSLGNRRKGAPQRAPLS